jgi:hypothetical protein
MSNIKKQPVTKKGVVKNAAQEILRRQKKERKCWYDDCDQNGGKTIFEYFGFGPCCSSRDGDNDDDD